MKKILFLGDSLTDCERLYSRDGLGNGYVKILSEKLPYKLINSGYNGFMAEDIDRRLKRFLEVKPDFVSLLVGVNNVPSVMAGRHAFESFAKAYENILKGLKGYKTLVILPFVFSTPAELISWRKTLGFMTEDIIRLCQKYGFPYLPMNEVFKEESEKLGDTALTPDGIHLTALGHKILAENWLKAFEEIK